MRFIYLFVIATFIMSGVSIAYDPVELCKRCNEDILYKDQAQGRFDWLKKCHQNILIQYFNKIWPDKINEIDATKINLLYQDWFYFHNPATGKYEQRTQILFPTFANISTSQNIDSYFAKSAEVSACDILPPNYGLVAVCNGSDPDMCVETEGSLYAEEARGRFYWLERCYPNVLNEYYDSLFKDPPQQSTKIEFLKNEWLYKNGTLSSRPWYPVLGTSYTHETGIVNPEIYCGGRDINFGCKELPSGYYIVAVLRAQI